MTHTVFFWLKDDLDEAQLATFDSELRKLPEIEAVGSGTVGVPAKTENRPVTDHSFSYHLSLRFDSIEKHDVYQVDEAHLAFVEKCKDFWTRVLVYDSE